MVIITPKSFFSWSVAYFPNLVCTTGNANRKATRSTKSTIPIKERTAIFFTDLIFYLFNFAKQIYFYLLIATKISNFVRHLQYFYTKIHAHYLKS